MKNTQFICSCHNDSFQKKGNYWICSICGEKYKRSTFIYQGREISDTPLEGTSIRYNLKGRKVNKINDKLIGVLYKNKYHLLNIDYPASETKIFDIDKNTASVISCKNHYIATEFDGKVLLYTIQNDMEVKRKINRKMEFITSVNDEFWLVLDEDRLCVYDLEGNFDKELVNLNEELQAVTIKVINKNVNDNLQEVVIYISYTKDGYDRNAGIRIQYLGDRFDYEIIVWNELYKSMEYVFDKGIFFGISGEKLYQINQHQEKREKLSLPLQVTITDGGMFKPERFVNVPDKMILWKDRFVLVYLSGVVIIDRHSEKMIFHFMGKEGDLIQSCEVLDEKLLSFSSGQNVYIVERG